MGRARKHLDELPSRELGTTAKEAAGERSLESETTRHQELLQTGGDSHGHEPIETFGLTFAEVEFEFSEEKK